MRSVSKLNIHYYENNIEYPVSAYSCDGAIKWSYSRNINYIFKLHLFSFDWWIKQYDLLSYVEYLGILKVASLMITLYNLSI